MRSSIKNLSIGLALGLVAGVLGSPPASAQTKAELRVAVGAPPPPNVVFKKEPGVILIPKSRVYYVPKLKYDLFRYGRYWYINNQGDWYRARSYRGPFTHLEFDRIPKSVTQVPAKYHKQPLRSVNRKSGIRAIQDANRSQVKQTKPNSTTRKKWGKDTKGNTKDTKGNTKKSDD